MAKGFSAMGGLFSSSSKWEATSRKVLITGASSGIGAELARIFAKEGAQLALLGRNEERLQAVARECETLGAEIVKMYVADLIDNKDIDRVTKQALQDFVGFDVVILNAGRSQGCYFEEINDVEQVDYMMKLNVSGVINPLQKLLPSIYKSKNSRIVFVSSTAGIIPVAYRSIYCASKFAVTGFAGALRMELNDTYGAERAPKVCLVAVPEVNGTNLNAGRMDFGATQPPAQFKNDTSADLEPTCQQLMQAIRNGDREWGLPAKVRFMRPLSSLLPELCDNMVLKHLRKTHYRPAAVTDGK